MDFIELAEGLWAFEQIFVMPPGLHLPTRSHVVRLPSGELLIVSPIPELTQAKTKIDALGEVRALIAHTSFHHLGLAAAAEAWPEATVYGIPELAKKRPDLTFHETLGAAPEPLWAGVLDQHLVLGAPKLGEVVFFHRPSKTLILGDLAFNVPRPDAWLTRVVFTLTGSHGHFGPSRLVRRMIKDWTACAASVRAMLAWAPERVVMAHGLPVETRAAEALRQAFAFLEPGR